MIWDGETREQVATPLSLGRQVARSLPIGARTVASSVFVVIIRHRVWDADHGRTGDSIPSALRFHQIGLLTTSNRFITVSHPNLLRAWDLRATALPIGCVTGFPAGFFLR